MAKTIGSDRKIDVYPDLDSCANSKVGPQLLVYVHNGIVLAQQFLGMEEMMALMKIWSNSSPTIHPDLVLTEEDEVKQAALAAAEAVPRRSRRKGTLKFRRRRKNVTVERSHVFLSDLLGELPLMADYTSSMNVDGGLSTKRTIEFINSCTVSVPPEESIKRKAVVGEIMSLDVVGMQKKKLEETTEARKRSFNRMMKFYDTEPLLGSRLTSEKQDHKHLLMLSLKLKRKKRRKLVVFNKRANGKSKPKTTIPIGRKPSRLQQYQVVPHKNIRSDRKAFKQNCKKVFSLLSKELSVRHSRSEPIWRERRDFCYEQIKSLLVQKKPQFSKIQLHDKTLQEYVEVLLDRVLSNFNLDF